MSLYRRILLIVSITMLATIETMALNITGKIKSNSSSSLLKDGCVKVYSDSSVIASGMTDSKGHISLECPSTSGIITIDITADGHETITIVTEGDKNDIALGDILLNPLSIKLGEVSVSAQTVVNTAGRTIIIPTQTEIKRATDPLNLLRMLSYKSSDLQINQFLGTISINGKTPQVLINGVPRTIDDVKTLMPERILKIDYTVIPDIRYGGIPSINIILRPVPSGYGAMADIRLALTTTREIYNASGTYVKGNNEINLVVGGTYRNAHKEFQNTREQYISPDETITLEGNGLPSGTIDFDNRIKLDYTHTPDKNKIFVATTNIAFHDNRRKNFSDYTGDNEDYLETKRANYKFFVPKLKLYYRSDMGSKGTIELLASTSISKGNYNNTISYSTGYDSRTLNNNMAWNVHGGATYSRKISKVHSVSGISYTFNRSRSNYHIDNNPVNTSIFRTNTLRAFSSLSGELLTFSYALNALVSYKHIDKGYTLPGGYISLFRNILPGLSGNYYFWIQSSAPRTAQLTNVLRPLNSYLYTNGNYDLKSQWNHTNDLKLNYNHKHFFVSLSGNIQRSYNPIVSTYEYISDPASEIYGKFLSIEKNARHQTSISTGLSAGFNNLLGHFSFNTYVGWNKQNIRGEDIDYTLCRFTNGLNIAFYIGNFQLDAEATIVPSKTLSGLSVHQNYSFQSLRASYKFGRWNASVFWSMPFARHAHKQKFWIISDVHPSSTVTWMSDQNNMVEFSIRYQLYKGHRLKKGNQTISDSSVDTGR